MANSVPTGVRPESRYRFTNSLNLATVYGNPMNLTADQLKAVLKDGIVTKQGTYGAILTRTNSVATSYWGFEVLDDTRLWGVGNYYSDSGGPSGQNLNIYKLKDGTYQLYATVPTRTDGEWYVVIERLEPGDYRVSGAATYTGFDELYFEMHYEKKLLLRHDDNCYCNNHEDLIYDLKMTSNESPEPYKASASSSWSVDFYPYKLFNGTNVGNADCWVTVNGTITGWAQLNFGAKTRVDYVKIVGADRSDVSTTSPKDFNILGSMDGVNFDLLLEVRNQTGWTARQERIFKLDKAVFYSEYRIQVLSNNGYSGYTAIGQFIFGRVKSNIVEIPQTTESNFVKYGKYDIGDLEKPFDEKDFVLQSPISKNEDGLLISKIDRKPYRIGIIQET